MFRMWNGGSPHTPTQKTSAINNNTIEQGESSKSQRQQQKESNEPKEQKLDKTNFRHKTD